VTILPQHLGTVTPSIKVMHLPLAGAAQEHLIRTVVETSLHRPGMFELTFVDRFGTILDLTPIAIGVEVEISVGSMPSSTKLIVGEITAIEGDYDNQVLLTVVRGYEHSHRLQKARRSRTFLDSTDGEIARQVASDARLSVGEISDPGVGHAYVAQVAQTDWEFLKGRAAEIGYDVRVVDGKFTFGPAPGMSSGGLGGVVDQVGSLLGGNTLTFGENLRWLRPRITSGGMVAETEVRVWDPDSVSCVSGLADLESATADLDDDPASLADAHGGLFPALPAIPLLGTVSSNAFAVVDRPMGWGSAAQSEADAVAAGFAEHVASAFAEAEGCVINAPGVQAGAKVTLAGVPDRFAGDWYVTSARHEIDAALGYSVRFEVSGRHDRSLHGLATGGRLDRRARGLIDGLVPGIVTNIADDQDTYRVKVMLPWLAPDFETDWARVVMPGLGASYGLVMLPEVDDEVLVGFEFGDPRRAYVLGGLANGNSALELGGDAVKSVGMGDLVVKRGLVSRLGHKLLVDDDGDGMTPPSTSGITIGNADDTITIQLDDVSKKLTILCDAASPPAAIEIKQNGAGGSITIEQAGSGGSIAIKSGGSVSLEAGQGELSLKGKGVTIDGGAGTVTLSGSQVNLN
jgi:hypothetical protein